MFYDLNGRSGSFAFWPIPQPTIYEMHVGFKVVLPRFQSLQQKINFCLNTRRRLNWCLRWKRLRVVHQMPASDRVNALARDALNTIRLGNTAMSTQLPMHAGTRNRAYDTARYRLHSNSRTRDVELPP